MTAGLLFGLNAALNLILMLALARAMPADAYGSLATWTAGALFFATAVFDWIRFSAMRFYTPQSRRDEPGVGAALDLAFLSSAPLAAAAVALVAVVNWLPGLTPAATLALVALTIGNAASEYLAALARNLLRTRVYARLIMLRHSAVFAVVVPVAAFTRDPVWTLAALALAVWPSVIVGAVALQDADARPAAAAKGRAARYFSYGVPLISAEAVFQGISLVNRAWLAAGVGLAAAGTYALTFDLAFKVIAVAASMGEAALLPRLVRQDAPDAALGPLLTRNIALMLFLTVPAAVAFGVLARPFAELALAPDFRPGFLAAADFPVGAAALYTLQTYMLRPAFQLGLKTAPLVQAALLALAIDVLGLFALKAQGATGVMMAHLLGLGGGAALLLGRTLIGLKVRWPVADTLKLAISGALMAAAGWFASAQFTPALLAILAAGVAMAAAFSPSAFAFDIAGIRRMAMRAEARKRTMPKALLALRLPLRGEETGSTLLRSPPWPLRARGLFRGSLSAGSHARQRSRSQPILRPRGALCARRRQHGRGGRPRGGRTPVRLQGRGRIECGGAGSGARRPERADHEGGAAPRPHPGPCSTRIRGRTAKASIRGAADGRGVRAPAHAGGVGAGLAGPLRLVRSQAGGRGLARPGPSRGCQRRLAARLQAA